MQRLDDGQPLRDAIASAGLSISQLAAETRRIDPKDQGVSKSAIGHLVSVGTSARDTCSTRTADLIAAALRMETGTFFAA